MEDIAVELTEIVENAEKAFHGIREEEWSCKSAPEKWSKKEILGHLIDSASNNHQRFVRAQRQHAPQIIYEQNRWVEAQNYADAQTENLIRLFTAYNRHLAHVLFQMSPETGMRLCDINKEQPVTVEWLAQDYIRHLLHHLSVITGEE